MKILVFRSIAILLGLFTGLLIFEVGWRALKTTRRNLQWPLLAKTVQNVYYPGPWMFRSRYGNTSIGGILVPFSEDVQWGAKHNSHGFRTPEYTIAHPPRTCRIVVIGDSVTWGQGVALEETSHQRLGQYLKRQPLFADCATEVIGLGVCGHRFIDNVIKLFVHAQNLHPDLVIIQLFFNDLDFYFYGQNFLLRHDFNSEDFEITRLIRFATFNPATFLANRYNYILNRQSLDWKIFMDGLECLKSWSNSNSTPILFVNFPHFLIRQSGFEAAEEFQPVIKEIQNKGFPVIELDDKYKPFKDRKLSVSDTDGHPNALADDVAAQALYEFLQTHKWLLHGAGREVTTDPRWQDEKELREKAERNWIQYNRSLQKRLEFFKAIHDMYPEDAWTTASLAYVYAKLHEGSLSQDLYSSLEKTIPQWSAPWYNEAMTLNGERQIELLQKMTDSVPDQLPAMELLSTRYFETGKISQACGLVEHLLAIENNPSAYKKKEEQYRKFHCETIPHAHFHGWWLQF